MAVNARLVVGATLSTSLLSAAGPTASSRSERVVSVAAATASTSASASASKKESSATALSTPKGGLARLHAEEPFEWLEVEGHGDALLSLPLGTTRKRPVVIAAHGRGSRPDWQCWAA